MGTTYNNREYVVIDTAQQDIAALTALFRADQQGQPPTLSTYANFILTAAPNLVISSINSYHVLQHFIDSAQVSTAIRMEEVNDPAVRSSTPDLTIESTLLRAAQRLGTANVRVTLPPLTQSGPIPAVPGNQAAVNTLTSNTTTPVRSKPPRSTTCMPSSLSSISGWPLSAQRTSPGNR